MESIFSAVLNEDSVSTDSLLSRQRHLNRDRFYKDLYHFNELKG